MSNVETKDFNVLIDGKIFFDVPIKNNDETYKKIIEMRKIVITPLVTYSTINTFKIITN